MVAIVLLVVGLFQFAELILKKPRKGYRILNVVIIGLILILSYYRPYGIIDFNRIEGEDILFVMREGVTNCTTSIRLKKDNRFKKTTICFGVDHYWGTYQLVNDTVKLEYNQIPEDSEGAEFLVIHKDTTENKSDQVFYHYGKRIKDGIGMGIVELRKELLY